MLTLATSACSCWVSTESGWSACALSSCVIHSPVNTSLASVGTAVGWSSTRATCTSTLWTALTGPLRALLIQRSTSSFAPARAARSLAPCMTSCARTRFALVSTSALTTTWALGVSTSSVSPRPVPRLSSTAGVLPLRGARVAPCRYTGTWRPRSHGSSTRRTRWSLAWVLRPTRLFYLHCSRRRLVVPASSFSAMSLITGPSSKAFDSPAPAFVLSSTTICTTWRLSSSERSLRNRTVESLGARSSSSSKASILWRGTSAASVRS
mmetsp:Transcript_158951/g.509956  ORF Transcript_158951/g.509956 Transcript_158951/m.509956 type:complete len:266 (-) Transcript_158951:1562-2359(-)